MMPGFPNLTEQERKALVAFLMGEDKKENTPVKDAAVDKKARARSPYKISGYSKFLDKDQLPAVKPPWGTLNAINLNTGEYVWKVPLGEHPELVAKGIVATGAENYGGPVVTASGLLLIAGTRDGKFRAFDKVDGKLIWEINLPAAAFATPSTYAINGKQYVVLACGGTKLGAPQGDSYVAYALP
jgi:quinoprotein glucose dehydrogenase